MIVQVRDDEGLTQTNGKDLESGERHRRYSGIGIGKT